MRGAGTFPIDLSQWGRGLVRFVALLAVALHIFAVEGHVHAAHFGAGAAAQSIASGGAAKADRTARPSLSNTATQTECIFCQTMAASGPGLAPSAHLLVQFGAAALFAAMFGKRQVALQRLCIWRSRAPPHRL